MNQHLFSMAATAGLLMIIAPASHAAPVEYVRVCSLYGAAFHYVPGTDTCLNELTGDARVQTEAGTWRSLLPYPEGKWATSQLLDCLPGRVVNLGTFSAADFSPNAWDRKQTRAIPVNVQRGEFITKVTMSGGFFDPRLPSRHGTNGTDGICVRSVDASVMENTPDGAINPPFGNGMLPVACVANSRIVGMPTGYTVNATSAYPSVDSFYYDGSQTTVSGPYTYGNKLVVTTDFGNASFRQLTYFDSRAGTNQPLAGSVSVSACLQSGSAR